MVDVHNKAIRSLNMSRIRSKNTKPEMIVRKYLFKNGYRFRLHDMKLPGKPDLVLPKYKTIIFVHGCFWHGHKGCRFAVIPATRTEWWKNKITRTKLIDLQNKIKLEESGWRIITIYECELKKNKIISTFNFLTETLKK